jgi:hypothetical protein
MANQTTLSAEERLYRLLRLLGVDQPTSPAGWTRIGADWSPSILSSSRHSLWSTGLTGASSPFPQSCSLSPVTPGITTGWETLEKAAEQARIL